MKILIIAITIFSFNSVWGQKALTKAEIKDILIKELQEKEQSIKNSKHYDLDEDFATSFHLFNENIMAHYDTCGFIRISRYDFVRIDSSENGVMPTEFYFFWKDSGKTYLQKAKNYYLKEPIMAAKFSFFEVYSKNTFSLDHEYIFPAVEGGNIDRKSFSINKMKSSHANSYTIFCKIGKNEKAIEFSENDITDSRSLFYTDNLKSKLYEWLLSIQKDMRKFFKREISPQLRSAN